jgi:hypothetical protein
MRGLTLLLALGALMTPAAPPAWARRVAPDDWDKQDRLDWERDERKSTRDAARGWTWAAMPPLRYEDQRLSLERDDDNTNRPLVRVTALSATTSGDAIVGGAVRGPIQLGATSVGMTQTPRGFIARVGRSGSFRMIQLGERESHRIPSALAIDGAGRIIVSYEHGSLEVMTPGGRAVWSRDLPPARALAFAANGDILAAGCRITRRLTSSQFTKSLWHYDEIRDGYFARITPRGEIRWTDRLDRGDQQLFYRPNDRAATDCATGIAPGPGDDIYVAGDFTRWGAVDHRDDDPALPLSGSFLARVSDGGRIAWSRLVAAGNGRVSLAAARDGSVALVAGQVANLDASGTSPSQGLAAFDPAGLALWSMPITSAPGQPTAAPEIAHLRIAAHGTSKTDFVCVGTYNGAIAAGGSSLSEADGGVFLVALDRRGSVISLRGVPGKARPSGAGRFITSIALAPGAATLWIGGTLTSSTHGAWVHARPW